MVGVALAGSLAEQLALIWWDRGFSDLLPSHLRDTLDTIALTATPPMFEGVWEPSLGVRGRTLPGAGVAALKEGLRRVDVGA